MPLVVASDNPKAISNGSSNNHHTNGASQAATLPNGGGGGGAENGFHYPHISSLPPREPIDIQFKDVTYTVNLGYLKGECCMTGCDQFRYYQWE